MCKFERHLVGSIANIPLLYAIFAIVRVIAFHLTLFDPEQAPVAKTNSLLVKDVTVPDGTTMAPSHPFTKIWRVRNNGSTRWPYGTKLVWDGGHLAPPSSVRSPVCTCAI